MNCDTGSFSRIRPSSTSFITLVVVATTLVSEAQVEDRVLGHRFRGRQKRALSEGVEVANRVAAGRRARRHPAGRDGRSPPRRAGAMGAKPAPDSPMAPRLCATGRPVATRAARASAVRVRCTGFNIYWRRSYRFFMIFQGVPRACVTVFMCPRACWPRYWSRLWPAALPRRPGALAARSRTTPVNRLKGATITAENPSASPSSFTATTDDKGRFSIIRASDGRLGVHGAGARVRARVRQAERADDRRAETRRSPLR